MIRDCSFGWLVIRIFSYVIVYNVLRKQELLPVDIIGAGMFSKLL